MFKKAFTAATVMLLVTVAASAQQKTSEVRKPAPKTCTQATCKTADKGKSCCKQPTRTMALRKMKN
jgi:hypothetical protein